MAAKITAREKKISKVLQEFKRGMLKTSAGKRITSEKQALAVALSEAARLPGRKSKEAKRSIVKGRRIARKRK